MKAEINNVTKKYGKKEILSGVSFFACGGECVGILGGNGKGKSTLLSVLAKTQDKNGGEFLLDGEDLFKNKALHRDVIGYVPQGTPLIPELNAYDNLALWYDRASLKKELSDGVLKMLGIDAFLKTPVSKMSGGMKKRLSIGCAVAHKPPVLLLDEPMAALDIACKLQISDYLNAFKKAGGIIILATHDVTELSLCDRFYILKDGQLAPYDYDGDIRALADSL